MKLDGQRSFEGESCLVFLRGDWYRTPKTRWENAKLQLEKRERRLGALFENHFSFMRILCIVIFIARMDEISQVCRWSCQGMLPPCRAPVCQCEPWRKNLLEFAASPDEACLLQSFISITRSSLCVTLMTWHCFRKSLPTVVFDCSHCMHRCDVLFLCPSFSRRACLLSYLLALISSNGAIPSKCDRWL